MNIKKEIRKIKSKVSVDDFPKLNDLKDLKDTSKDFLTKTSEGTSITVKRNTENDYVLSNNHFLANVDGLNFSVNQTLELFDGCKISDGEHFVSISFDRFIGTAGTLDTTNKSKITFKKTSLSEFAEITKLENGLNIDLIIDSLSNMNKFGCCYNIVTSANVKTIFCSDLRKVVFVDKETNNKIFEFDSIMVFDANDNCLTNPTMAWSEENLNVYALNVTFQKDWAEHSKRAFPLRITSKLSNVAKSILKLHLFKDSARIYSLKNESILGIKDNESYSINAIVNSEQIISYISKEKLKTYQILLSLNFKLGTDDSKIESILAYNGANNLRLYKDGAGIFKVDITKLIQDEFTKYEKGLTLDNLVITLMPKNKILSQSNFSLGTIAPITIEDDYITIYNENSDIKNNLPAINILKVSNCYVDPSTPFKEYDVGKAGVSKLNLCNREHKHILPLGTISSNSLDVNVDLMYDTRFLKDENSQRILKNNFSDGWLLNVSQRLIKDKNYRKLFGSKSITYIDGENNAHLLEEKWYYTLDNVRHYIDKTLVIIGNDKKLKYFDESNQVYYDVEYEASSDDGLTLITTNSKLNYIRQADLKVKKHYYIRLLDNQKFEVFTDDEGLLRIPHFPSNSVDVKDAEYRGLLTLTNTIYMIDDVKSYLPPNKIKYVGRKFLDEKGNYLPCEYLSKELLFNGSEYYVIPTLFITPDASHKVPNKIEKINYDSKEKLKVEIENEYYLDKNYVGADYYENEDISDLNNRIMQYEEQIKQLKENILSSSETVIDAHYNYNYSVLIKYYDMQKSITNEDYNIDTANRQFLKSKMSLKKAMDILIKYETQLMCLKEQKSALVKEQKESVQDYIVDTLGNVLGFDYYGKLIYISDKYENEIFIAYDEGKLTSIYSKDQKMIFHYNDDNLLEYLTDNKGRKKWFNYTDKMLTAICYLVENNDKLNISFTYNNGYLHTISDGVKQFKLDRTKRYIDVLLKTLTVIENNMVTNNGEESVIASDTINKLSIGSRCINNITKESNSYFFDTVGRLIYNYSRTEERKITKHVINYNGKNKMFDITMDTPKTLVSVSKEIIDNSSFLINSSDFSEIVRKYELASLEMVFDTDAESFDEEMLKNNEIVITIDVTDKNDKIRTFKHTFSQVIAGIIAAPFVLMKTDKSIKVVIHSQKELNYDYLYSKINVYRSAGIINKYDEDNNLIYSISEDGETFYKDFVDDKPTKISTIDKYGSEKTIWQQYDEDSHLVYVEDNLGNIKENIYDDKGQLIEEKSYNRIDTALLKTTKYKYDDKGNIAKLDGVMRNEFGEYPQETYTYENGSNNLKLVKKVNNQVISYGYDFNTDDVLSISSDALGKKNATTFKCTHGYVTELTHHGVKINYDLDGAGRKTKVAIGGCTKLVISYNDFYTYNNKENNKLVTITDAGGNEIKEIYDCYGKLLLIENPISQTINYTYDIDDRIVLIEHKNDSIVDEKIINTYSDNLLTKTEHKFKYEDINLVKVMNYYSNELLKENIYSVEDKIIMHEIFSYDESYNNRLYKIELPISSANAIFTYDTLERTTTEKIEYEDRGIIIANEYEYLQYDDNAIDLVKTHKYGYGPTSESVDYEYDVNGNIILEKGINYQIRYQYDKCNRLIREDNQKIKLTKLYNYDDGGNLLFVKECSYTLDDNVIVNNLTTFEYEKNGWKDQLIKFNDKEITYDNRGNIIQLGNIILNWNELNQLTECGDNAFAYDITGKRLTKNNTTYFYDGNRLLREKNGNNEIIYQYAMEKVIGFTYNGHRYIYQRNIQGDIVRIYDVETDEVVAEYSYDAWGNQNVKNKNEDNIGDINPIRYRGYYYDKETQLYWVSSRYYSPELCRWISPDSIEYLDPQSINGLNLYAYCGNDPVNRLDPTGHDWEWSSFWQGVGYLVTGIGAIVAGALVIASGVATWPMLLVAGITIGAGALTTINGASEVVEAGTGYNFVEDTVFGGNSSAYNTYATIVGSIATVGSIVCGGWYRYNTPRIQAYKNVGNYNFSGTLSDSTHLARPYQHSTLLQRNIIKYGKMVKESSGIYNFTIGGAYKIGWVSYGVGNVGSHPVIWKLVLDIGKQIILHAGF